MMPKMIADKLTKVLEAVFKDFQEGVDSAARNCRNNDASTALYELSSAIDAMDIQYIVREALEIPHDPSQQTPVVPDFEV